MAYIAVSGCFRVDGHAKHERNRTSSSSLPVRLHARRGLLPRSVHAAPVRTPEAGDGPGATALVRAPVLRLLSRLRRRVRRLPRTDVGEGALWDSSCTRGRRRTGTGKGSAAGGNVPLHRHARGHLDDVGFPETSTPRGRGGEHARSPQGEARRLRTPCVEHGKIVLCISVALTGK